MKLEENEVDSDELNMSSDDEKLKGFVEKQFKSFICPLCFRMMYKCTTTVCGHSFCEMCLDEYLIIRKVKIPLFHFNRLALFVAKW